ncbi:MAG: inovirus-type Gp2 protein [Acinetobacter sp.]
MEQKIDIDQNYPSNLLELTSEQYNGKFILKENPVVSSIFSMILSINQIERESLEYLFKLNNEGLSLKAYDTSIDLFLKGIYSIEQVSKSNYHCEHSIIFKQAYDLAVAPHIHPDDELSFWKAPPNRTFVVLDEQTGQLKSSHTTAQLKNALIREIFIRIDSPIFKATQFARSERSKHQYERSCELVQGLRDKFSKLLVLRIDFCWKAQIQDDVTFKEMKAYFAQMRKRFHHDKNLPNIVGYIWKLEFGQKKGYHYHCIFFMDGNKFQSDAHYAEVIGQYWSKLTLDKGYYFNCHRDKIKYRHLAIGMARHDDQTFFDNLNQVLVYICKQDQFLIDKHLLTPKLHVFGTSQPPKANTLGRPRKFTTVPKPTSQALALKSVITKKIIQLKP